MRNKLAEWGVKARVLDVTPQLFTDYGSVLVTSPPRGAEIAAWLDEHPTQQFVILDDDDDMAALREYLVQTDFRNGLTDSHVTRALSYFTSAPE